MSIKIRSYAPQDCQAIADIYNEAVAQGGITMDSEAYPVGKIQELVQLSGNKPPGLKRNQISVYKRGRLHLKTFLLAELNIPSSRKRAIVSRHTMLQMRLSGMAKI